MEAARTVYLAGYADFSTISSSGIPFAGTLVSYFYLSTVSLSLGLREFQTRPCQDIDRPRLCLTPVYGTDTRWLRSLSVDEGDIDYTVIEEEF